MPLYLVSPPSAAHPVLTLDEVKGHLHVDHTDDDAILTIYRDAIVGSIDGRDGWLGRALQLQSWELRLDDFCSSKIRIPLPPLREVESVKYYDPDDQLQTLSTDIYEPIGVGGFNPGMVALRRSKAWPSVSDRREAVLIRFKAGYRDAETPPVGEIPAPIKAGVLLTIGTLYANREDVIVGVSAIQLPGPAAALLSPFQVHYFG